MIAPSYSMIRTSDRDNACSVLHWNRMSSYTVVPGYLLFVLIVVLSSNECNIGFIAQRDLFIFKQVLYNENGRFLCVFIFTGVSQAILARVTFDLQIYQTLCVLYHTLFVYEHKRVTTAYMCDTCLGGGGAYISH